MQCFIKICLDNKLNQEMTRVDCVELIWLYVNRSYVNSMKVKNKNINICIFMDTFHKIQSKSNSGSHLLHNTIMSQISISIHSKQYSKSKAHYELACMMPSDALRIGPRRLHGVGGFSCSSRIDSSSCRSLFDRRLSFTFYFEILI